MKKWKLVIESFPVYESFVISGYNYKEMVLVEVLNMSKNQTTYYKHLSLNDRITIQTAIVNNASKKAIAMTLGKDPSTIAKEIKRHRLVKPSKRVVINHKQPIEACARRDRSPGACNGCDTFSVCKNKRYVYDAHKAHKEYLYDLSDSRAGINLTISQRNRIGKIIAPLINQGQSIAHILINHPEIGLSDKSLYNYIDQGVFHDFGIINLSLKEKVKRKQFKDKYKSRKKPASYTGHTYDDYLSFIQEHPQLITVEMDTVMNSTSGPYLQTFMFPNTKIMIGFIKKHKTSESMAASLAYLEEQLGSSLYEQLFSLVLTDRGPEFEIHKLFEFNEAGKQRTHLFYCDPMCSWQKPNVENNHNYVRDILPNGYSMDALTQTNIETMFTHINNTPRASLGNRTPIEMLQFLYRDNWEKILIKLHIKILQPDEVTLRPSVLKAK